MINEKRITKLTKGDLEDLVTIVIPVKNGASLINSAVESINNQSINFSKVILADNNSTDNTIEIVKNNLKKSINLEIYKSKKDIPSMENFFRCIDKVDTEYFCWLAHDDYFADNWVEENLKVHFENKNCITSFGYTVFLDENDKRIYPTGINKKMHVPRSYLKADLKKFILERQLFSVFYEFGINKTLLFKKEFSKEKVKQLISQKLGGDTTLVLSLLSKGSLISTPKTIFYRRFISNSNGAKQSKTNILWRIFILELPLSYFIYVSDWIASTYKKPKYLILIFLLITSRLQSLKKMIIRLSYEIKNILK